MMCLQLLTPVYAVTQERVREHRFDVLLDGKPIGEHRFVVSDSGNERRVSSEASFDVKVLFVPVYSYRHTNTESWRDGCLRRIESETDSNGKTYRVVGEDRGGEFVLSTQAGSRMYPGGCMMTFAYWDQQMLRQDRLLNAQTGELVDVEIAPLGSKRVEVEDGSVVADAFRITSASDDGIDIRVFYQRDTGRWLSLESTLENGRVMRYLPSDMKEIVMAGRAPVGQDERGGGL
jgi:hypothetical protein